MTVRDCLVSVRDHDTEHMIAVVCDTRSELLTALDHRILQERLKLRYAESDEERFGQLVDHGMALEHDGKYMATVAGASVLGRTGGFRWTCPKMLRMARFVGNDMGRIRVMDDHNQGYALCFNTFLNDIRMLLPSEEVIRLYRVRVEEYPTAGIRELLGHAVSKHDPYDRADIKFAIYDDSVTIDFGYREGSEDGMIGDIMHRMGFFGDPDGCLDRAIDIMTGAGLEEPEIRTSHGWRIIRFAGRWTLEEREDPELTMGPYEGREGLYTTRTGGSAGTSGD